MEEIDLEFTDAEWASIIGDHPFEQTPLLEITQIIPDKWIPVIQMDSWDASNITSIVAQVFDNASRLYVEQAEPFLSYLVS